jgi:hypothetical protein
MTRISGVFSTQEVNLSVPAYFAAALYPRCFLLNRAVNFWSKSIAPQSDSFVTDIYPALSQ